MMPGLRLTTAGPEFRLPNHLDSRNPRHELHLRRRVLQRRGGFDKKRGRWNWQVLSFISSNRDILLRSLREKGIVPDPGKMEEVLALPYTFKEWIAQRQSQEDADARPSRMEEAA